MAIQYNSNFEETVPFSDVCVQFALSTNSSNSFTVPGSATTKYSVRFGYNSTSNIFVGLNTTATVPTGGTKNTQQYVEFRPGCDGSKRYVQGGDVLNFITSDAAGAFCSIALSQLPG